MIGATERNRLAEVLSGLRGPSRLEVSEAESPQGVKQELLVKPGRYVFVGHEPRKKSDKLKVQTARRGWRAAAVYLIGQREGSLARLSVNHLRFYYDAAVQRLEVANDGRNPVFFHHGTAIPPSGDPTSGWLEGSGRQGGKRQNQRSLDPINLYLVLPANSEQALVIHPRSVGNSGVACAVYLSEKANDLLEREASRVG
jgi:hypothetical protein